MPTSSNAYLRYAYSDQPAERRPPAVARIKVAALSAITTSRIATLFRPFTSSAAVVFMLHRFSGPGHDTCCHDPKVVRALLAYLRREGHQLVDLETLFASLAGKAPPVRHAVAFTIDDGYSEHATVAAPLFAEFDCPVTTFVTTGFLDGALWFWWDQIRYVFTTTALSAVRIELDDATHHYSLGQGTVAERAAAADTFTAHCKTLTAPERTHAIRQLADAAEVSIPRHAPAAYAPMTWDALRAAEHMGMTFGPHTVTHPFLGRVTESEARDEIVRSWSRLREEATKPVPILAYPNGQPGDFGEREFRLLAEAGLVGAVTSVGGFATKNRYRSPNGAFTVPRFPLPDSLPYLIQHVDGLERFKALLRGHDSQLKYQL